MVSLDYLKIIESVLDLEKDRREREFCDKYTPEEIVDYNANFNLELEHVEEAMFDVLYKNI